MTNERGPFIDNSNALDRFSVALRNLYKVNRDDIADLISAAKDKIVSNENIHDAKKLEHIELMALVAEEVAKPEPDPRAIEDYRTLMVQSEDDSSENPWITIFKWLAVFI